MGDALLIVMESSGRMWLAQLGAAGVLLPAESLGAVLVSSRAEGHRQVLSILLPKGVHEMAFVMVGDILWWLAL